MRRVSRPAEIQLSTCRRKHAQPLANGVAGRPCAEACQRMHAAQAVLAHAAFGCQNEVRVRYAIESHQLGLQRHSLTPAARAPHLHRSLLRTTERQTFTISLVHERGIAKRFIQAWSDILSSSGGRERCEGGASSPRTPEGGCRPPPGEPSAMDEVLASDHRFYV